MEKDKKEGDNFSFKVDNYRERKPDLGLIVIPKEPLNKEERELLTIKLLTKISIFYEKIAESLGLTNDFEKKSWGSCLRQHDARNDGVLSFYRCLDKFDKTPYLGKISDDSVFGADKPKTIEFYFYVWAKTTIRESLLDDLKVMRGRKVYTTYDGRNDNNIPTDISNNMIVAEEKKDHAFVLYNKMINGIGGESVASKLLAVECENDEELTWYIFNSKIEGVRNKNMILEYIERNPYLETDDSMSEEMLMDIKKKNISKASEKIKELEARTQKIFKKIKKSTNSKM